jgi:hypothetical protein
VSEEWIGRQIDAWDAGQVAAATAKLREDCRDHDAVAEFQAIYGQVVEEFRGQPLVDLEAEFEAIASVLGVDLSTRAKELQERIRSMNNSWSWRLTYPLRVFDDAVRGRVTSARAKRSVTKGSLVSTTPAV